MASFKNEMEMNKEFDALIAEIASAVSTDESRPAVVRPSKYKQMEFVEACMLYLTKGTNASVSSVVNSPFKSMGSVTVETDAICFRDPIWFARAAEFAANVEIYPLVEDRIRIEFAFYGLAVPLG